jgi:OHCU decarboxylase
VTEPAGPAEDRAAFLARLGHVAEGSPWVAERAWARGPFPDAAATADAFAAVVRESAPEEQLALIRAHPDLAGRAALAGDLTADSAREQASAGLDRLTPDDLARFTRLNDAYRARFGFPFVIRVAGRSVDAILAAYEERLANDADAERATAVEQIAEIMRLRIEAAA